MVVCLTLAKAQQELLSTQFMFNKMAINPALAGQEKYTGITAMIRDQWNGLPGSPKSQMLTVNLPRTQDKIGLGFTLKNQQVGIFRHTTIGGIYSYKFLLGDGALLSMGVEFNARSFVADFTDPALVATQGLTTDPSIPQGKQSINILMLGMVYILVQRNFYVGASVPRLIKQIWISTTTMLLRKKSATYFWWQVLHSQSTENSTYTPRPI